MNRSLTNHTLIRFAAVCFLVLLGLPLIFSGRAQAVDFSKTAVLYKRGTYDTAYLPVATQLEWFFLDSPSVVHKYSLDELSTAWPWALTTGSPYVAFADAEGWVYIVNLTDRSLVNLQVQTYSRSTFACADESAPFGNVVEGAPLEYMQWSPDGKKLVQ